MEQLRDLGYEYKDGKLVQVGTDKGFEFQNQEHYDKLADAVLRYVGTLLVEQAKLEPIALPLGVGAGEPQTVVFASEGIEKAEKVLLLIQGSGRVRVGVWGCALCINKDLDQGTMLPYLRKAAEEGYGVLVLNPNENECDGMEIPGSESPPDHVAYVWKHIVQARCSKDATVDIVAHSNGGRCLIHFLAWSGPRPHSEQEVSTISADAAARIRRVVFTDSYHDSRDIPLQALPEPVQAALADPTRYVNYVPHPAPLGTAVERWISLGRPFSQPNKGCQCLSAAVEDHAATNQAALHHAFEWLAK